MDGSSEVRSWLRCYRCWSQNLELQVHYEGINRIDPDTGERSEVVDEIQEAAVQCVDCIGSAPTGPTLPDPARSPTVPRCPHPGTTPARAGYRRDPQIRFRSAEVKDRGAALPHTRISGGSGARAETMRAATARTVPPHRRSSSQYTPLWPEEAPFACRGQRPRERGRRTCSHRYRRSRRLPLPS